MRLFSLALVLLSLPMWAQHDISKVEPAPTDGAIVTPIEDIRGRRLKKYDILDLNGARQAIGSQLIDGRLRKPLIDYISREGTIQQRVSLFEGGLVVIDMSGGTNIRKKVLLPDEAHADYMKHETNSALRAIKPDALPVPDLDGRSALRVYEADGTWIERVYNPRKMLPKAMSDQIAPMLDLLRAVAEDRSVTTSVAGYEPKPGDELIADDQKVYRVVRIVDPPGVVELKCLDAPTSMFIAKKDLDQYFIGARKLPPADP
jgi:hypothetical protein